VDLCPGFIDFMMILWSFFASPKLSEPRKRRFWRGVKKGSKKRRPGINVHGGKPNFCPELGALGMGEIGVKMGAVLEGFGRAH